MKYFHLKLSCEIEMGIKVWATLLNALDENNEIPKFGTSQLCTCANTSVGKNRYPLKNDCNLI